MRWMIGVLLGLIGMEAGAQDNNEQMVVGDLEVVWGDLPYSKGHSVLDVHLRDPLGRRHRLDPEQAKRAAGDLYMMSGKKVGVLMHPSKGAGSSTWNVEAIVPAQLADNAQHTVAKQAVAQGANIQGTTRWVTLACKFSDITTEQKSISFFTGQYGTSPGQLGHYWNEVSYGAVDLTGSQAYGWFTLPLPRASYVPSGGKADLNKLFQDCVARADPSVNFQGVTGINMMFNGDLDGFAWGGTRCATLDGQNKCWSSTWNPPWSFNNLAPLAHEMGHGYGLPHSDNSDGDDDTYDNPWDNMSDSWNNGVPNATYGTLPKHINIFQRDRLGWVAQSKKVTIEDSNTQTQTITLDDASVIGGTNPQMLVLRMPSSSDPYATVLYTVEVRVRSGVYENRLAGDAVIIHKIVGTTAYSVDSDVPPATRSNNEGSMFKTGETWVSDNGTHVVRIDARTATGFVVSVVKPRVTGGNLPPRVSQ